MVYLKCLYLIVVDLFWLMFFCYCYLPLTGHNSSWNDTVYQLADTWKDMVNHLLLRSSDRPVLLVHFEDLKLNVFREIEKILTFIGYQIDHAVLRERLKNDFNTFYRNHTDSFEHFTPEQKEYVASVMASIDPLVAMKLRTSQFLQASN